MCRKSPWVMYSLVPDRRHKKLAWLENNISVNTSVQAEVSGNQARPPQLRPRRLGGGRGRKSSAK